MKIAVTGYKGRLGSEFIRLGCYGFDCDITSRESIREAIEFTKPTAIINCAAWTDVDGAENSDNEKQVIAVNLRGVGLLRSEFDGYIIHVSTGYVFDGKAGPYSEDDPPTPINFYGWSKLGGEAALAIRGPNLIVRTLDLYGPNTSTDFVRQIRDVLELGQPYELPTNLYGSPTYIPHLAEGMLSAAESGISGIVNIAGDEVLSRFSWGRKIADFFGFDPDLIIGTDEIKGSAPRPLRGGLIVDKAKSLGIPIYSPEDGLRSLAEGDNES